MMSGDKLAALIEKGEIEVAPLAYMRGRTLNDSFIILDEAQNTTPEQMKMFLTRLGFGSQDGGHRRRHADRPAARPASRAWHSCPRCSTRSPTSRFVDFDGHDVVRHKLVQRIVAAYKDYGERDRASRCGGGRSGGERATRRASATRRARAGRARRGEDTGRRAP